MLNYPPQGVILLTPVLHSTTIQKMAELEKIILSMMVKHTYKLPHIISTGIPIQGNALQLAT